MQTKTILLTPTKGVQDTATLCVVSQDSKSISRVIDAVLTKGQPVGNGFFQRVLSFGDKLFNTTVTPTGLVYLEEVSV
jgi:hypothetical protein